MVTTGNNGSLSHFSYRLRIDGMLLKEEFASSIADYTKPALDAVINAAQSEIHPFFSIERFRSVGVPVQCDCRFQEVEGFAGSDVFGANGGQLFERGRSTFSTCSCLQGVQGQVACCR